MLPGVSNQMKFSGPYCVQISFTCGKHFSRKYCSKVAGVPSGLVFGPLLPPGAVQSWLCE